MIGASAIGTLQARSWLSMRISTAQVSSPLFRRAA